MQIETQCVAQTKSEISATCFLACNLELAGLGQSGQLDVGQRQLRGVERLEAIPVRIALGFAGAIDGGRWSGRCGMIVDGMVVFDLNTLNYRYLCGIIMHKNIYYFCFKQAYIDCAIGQMIAKLHALVGRHDGRTID